LSTEEKLSNPAVESTIAMSMSSKVSIEERWATIDGARMRYLCAGSGPPIILLHGLLGYSFSWRFTIPVLARQATVYAPDMLGAGFSDRPSDLDCTFEGIARRVLAFADQVGIRSFHLLGTSHGGAVAMTAAALAAGQNRVRTLILVAPVNPWSSHGKRLTRFLSGELVSRLFLGIVPRAKFAHSCVLRRLYGDPVRISPGTLEGYSRPFEKPGGLEYGLRIVSSWNKDLDDLELSLPKIRNIPTLIIWGGLDRAVDPASARTLQAQFHDARVVTFEGVGHLAYEESPEQFNQAIAEFLRTQIHAQGA
jgi:pimeloyl-ACP methyl ester carboxylesterase